MNALKIVKNKPHTLLIEDLGIPTSIADQIVETIHDFLNGLGFSEDRISNLECRSRDGFSPFSHNKGGVEAIAFTDQYFAQMNGTGFENADEALEKYYKYDLENWMEQNKHPSTDSMNEKDWEAFDEYRREDSESTVLYSVDAMLTSETELNVRMCVCVNDAPYHRKYDDKLEFDIEFKSIAGLKQKLARLLKDKNVKQFQSNLREAY